MTQNDKKQNMVPRPPVVAVMGHIDHGKSTLLDYIRKTNVAAGEAGGITQHLSAYEVVHPIGSRQGGTNRASKDEFRKITFLDTPGHAAFAGMRERGVKTADIAILVVSAEDGVKPQTVEAWQQIIESKTPVIVAINKIDKPEANIEKTKAELAENGIYLEGYGGSIPVALISAKEGTGVDELLSLVLVLAELEDFRSDPKQSASGSVIEAHLDPKRGIAATLIIKNGTLHKGEAVAVGESICTTRIIENFLGENIAEAPASSPVQLVGFDKMPNVGSPFNTFKNKKEAQAYINKNKTAERNQDAQKGDEGENIKKIIPVVLKADVWGMAEAIEKEIEKIKSESAEFKIIQKGVGPISENDLKAISGDSDTLVIGFNVKTDKNATDLAQKRGLSISTFDIIYKMTEWLETEMERLRPKIDTEETLGQAKILKTFSRTKERQIVGGRVEKGKLAVGKTVKIMRRDFEIGKGKIVGLEKNKSKASDAEEGSEFGMMLESKVEVAPGDRIESFSVVKK